jgi:hypothetical protein
MALQLPNIYTLGQVQVSTQPLAQLQGQLLAKKQAREEALDKYFEVKTKELTKKGIADNDVVGYEDRLKKLQNYWTQNKADISKGGMSQRNFEYMVDDLKDYTGRSVSKKEELGKVYQLRIKGDISDDDIPLIGKIEAPLDDPSRLKPNGVAYGLGDFSAAVKLPDTQKQDAFWSAVSRDYKPKVIEYEKDAKGNFIYTSRGLGSFTNVYKFTERYADDQILGMADRAAEFVATDKDFRTLYDNILNDAAKATKENKPLDPRFVELQVAYNDFYPSDIMDRPEEVVKAAAIVRYKKFLNTGEKDVVDEKAEEKYKSASIISRQKAAGGEVDLSQYDVLGPYTKSKGVKTKGFFGIGAGKTLVYKKDIDPKDYELIADKDVMPFVDNNGEEYFEVDPNTGDWKAENATINASSAARRNLDRTTLSEEKRGALRFKPSVPAKTTRPPLSTFKKKNK